MVEKQLRYFGNSKTLLHLTALRELWSLGAQINLAAEKWLDKKLKERKYTIKHKVGEIVYVLKSMQMIERPDTLIDLIYNMSIHMTLFLTL